MEPLCCPRILAHFHAPAPPGYTDLPWRPLGCSIALPGHKLHPFPVCSYIGLHHLRAKPATMLRHACKLLSQGGLQGPLASAPSPCCSALLHHHHPLPGPTPHLVQMLLHADLPAHPELPVSAPCPHCSPQSETGPVPAIFILSSSIFSISLPPRPPELFQVS